MTDVSEWTLVEELRIGSLAGEDALTEIRDVAVMGDRIYVGQPRESVIRVFGANEGQLLFTFVGEGDGPGEFNGFFSHMGVISPDTLFVSDVLSRRTDLFSTEGDYLKTYRFGSVRVEGGLFGGAFGAFLPDGSGLLEFVYSVETPTDLALRANREAEVLDTAFTIRLTPSVSYPIMTEFGVISFDPLIDDDPVTHLPDDATLNVIVERDMPLSLERRAYRVYGLSGFGDTLFVTDVPFEPIPLSRDAADTLYFALAELLGPDMTRTFPTVAGAEARVRDFIPTPAHYPPVRFVRVTSDHYIWVGLYGPPGEAVRWDILTPEGALVGFVRLPASISILESNGETLWVSDRDELDIPYLVRYRIER